MDTSASRETIASLLGATRKALGLPQKDVASALGLEPMGLVRLETARKIATDEILVRFSEFIRLPGFPDLARQGDVPAIAEGIGLPEPLLRRHIREQIVRIQGSSARNHNAILERTQRYTKSEGQEAEGLIARRFPGSISPEGSISLGDLPVFMRPDFVIINPKVLVEITSIPGYGDAARRNTSGILRIIGMAAVAQHAGYEFLLVATHPVDDSLVAALERFSISVVWLAPRNRSKFTGN